MELITLSNIIDQSNPFEKTKLHLGAGEKVSVSDAAWNDSQPFVFLSLPEKAEALKVRKSQLMPV